MAFPPGGGGSGGGGPVTIASGADVVEGSTGDAAGASTVLGQLKALVAALAGTLAVSIQNATLAVTQSGAWTTGRTWVLGSGTDSVTVTGTVTAAQGAAGASAWKVDGSAVTQPVSGTVTANQGGAPWADNVTQVGGVAVAAAAKGTQGSNFLPVQDAKDTGRTLVILTLDRVAGITSEALATMTINKGGAVTTGTSYQVTAGKTLRLQALLVTILDSTTTLSAGRVRVRSAASVLVTSPVVIGTDQGNFTGTAAALAGQAVPVTIPDGLEIAAAQQVGISHLESGTTSTVSVCLIGYEY